jgi:hypothetical protein
MAKKTTKTRKQAKKTKAVRARKAAPPSKKKAKKRKAKARATGAAATPSSTGPVAVAHVSLFGMAELVRMFHDAGHEDKLNELLGPDPVDRAVKLDYHKFNRIKDFVGQQEEWKQHSLAMELNDCHCEEDDPDCVCWGHRSSFIG